MPPGQIFAPAPDRRAYQAEWLSRALDVEGLVRPLADPTASAANRRHAPGRPVQFAFGRVVDAVAYLHCYKVQLEGGYGVMVCAMAVQTGTLPVGARQINTLGPGAGVWVLIHPQRSHGVIIGVEPESVVDHGLILPDAIHPAGRCGLRVDAMHSAVLDLAGSGGVVDWSAGRPFDSTTAGEAGWIAETGVRVALDSFMAQIAADESCGVTAFYHDLLLRIAAHHLQEITAGGEREVADDQGEVHAYDGRTPYPWEQAGALRAGIDPFRDVADAASQQSEPHYGPVEPRHDDQMPFHRVVAVGGYLGQGGRRSVCLAPQPDSGSLSGDEPDVLRYGAHAVMPGVLEEQLALTGQYTLRSARGITLLKQPAIPTPKRMARMESATGDTEANYRFAGVAGDGPEHDVAAGPEGSDDDAPQLQAAAAFLDTVAYTCNWEGVHPFHYHEKDWYVPAEEDTPAATNQAPVAFADLADKFALDRPPSVAQTVDHRYGDVDYFLNSSHFALLPDGGVVIGDGWGSEIRMSGGHVTISCPGDIFLKSGRSTVTMAGRDAIVRARGSADVSASDGDVRVKAGANLQMRAGNDGGEAGAVLIESVGTAGYGYGDGVGSDVKAGGVQIKAAGGEVAVYGDDVYVRSVKPGGLITLDAGRGSGTVQQVASDSVRYLSGAAVDQFGSGRDVAAVNRASAAGATLGTGLDVAGAVRVLAGGASVVGGLAIAGGTVSADGAGDGAVVAVDAKAASDLRAALRRDRAAATSGAAAEAAAAYRRDVEDRWYGEDAAGSDVVVESIGFSFRTDEQYRTGDFVMYEDRWQQFARLAKQEVAAWTEPPVAAGSTATGPYPGRDAWAGRPSLREQDLAYYDQERGVATARGDAYNRPRLKESSPRPPDGRYAVIP